MMFSDYYPAAISIHALLAESDVLIPFKSGNTTSFLSTLSLRRATVPLHLFYSGICISIHALLAESDQFFPKPLLVS